MTDTRLLTAVTLLTLVLSLAPTTVRCGSVDYELPSECADDEFFDSTSLACDVCGSGTSASGSGDGLVVNADRTGCTCALGRIKVYETGTETWTCEVCGNTGYVASRDASVCMPCVTTAANVTCEGTLSTYDAASGTCICPDEHVLVETDGGGNYLGYRLCVECASNSILSSTDPYECVPCPDSIMERVDGSCVCPTGYAITSDSLSCLPGTSLTTVEGYMGSSFDIEFFDVEDASGGTSSVSVESYLLSSTLAKVGVECMDNSNATACQAVANLCVLQMYNEDGAACRLFDALTGSRVGKVHGENDWYEGLPWLVYDVNGLSDADAVQTVMSVSDPGEDSDLMYVMDFVLAKFALDGTFLGYETLHNQLQFCIEQPVLMDSYLNFGTNYYAECSISMLDIVEMDEPVFYDLYLVDGSELTPIPVRIINYRSGGSQPNVNDDYEVQTQTSKTDDFLVRRFFMYDNVAGKKEADGQPEVVRAASHIELQVELQFAFGSRENGRIYPPVIEIEYAERLVETIEGDPTSSVANPDVTFASVYTMDLTRYWRVMSGMLGMVGFLIVITCFGRYFLLMPQTDSSDGLNSMLQLAAVFLGAGAQLFFWFMAAVSWYWFMFFKWQAVPTILLPADTYNYMFQGIIGASLCAQVLYVGYIIYTQIKTTVFFIDWEESRGPLLHKSGDTRITDPAPISIWRTLFVANEWNELQTTRKVSIPVTLFALLVLLRVFNLEYLATPQPGMGLEPGTRNQLLRFGVTTFFWFAVVSVQLLINAIMNYFGKDTVVEFADFMSLANISAFVVCDGRMGYYIHGKSIRDFADANLSDLQAALQNEEMQTQARGLNDTEDQVFQVLLASNFKAAFMANYDSQRMGFAAANTIDGGGNEAAQPLQGTSSEAIAYNNMNEFLRSFVGGSSEYQYEIKKQSSADAWLHRMPTPTPGTAGEAAKTVFTPIEDDGYAKCMFYGREYELIMFNILFYAVADIITDSTFAAIMITYVADYVIKFVRGTYGEKALTKSSLVDDRFLL